MLKKLSHWLCRALMCLSSPKVISVVGKVCLLLTFRVSRRKKFSLSRFEAVLVIHLGDAGHALMTTGFLRELRRNLPKANITVIVRRGITNIMETCPYLDEIITFDSDEPRNDWERLRLRRRALRLAIHHLWKRRYDLAVIPRWDTAALLEKYIAYFCGARYRVGYGGFSAPVGPSSSDDPMLTHAIPKNFHRHQVEQHYEMVRFLGGEVKEERLEIWFTERDKAVISETLACCNFAGASRLIVFGIDAHHPRSLWPIERFAELGKWLIEELDARIVILGNREDKDRGIILQEKLGKQAIDLSGQMSWRQSAAILKQSHLYVGCGAVSTHLAGICNVETVMISHHPVSGTRDSLDAPTLSGPWCFSGVIVSPLAARPPCASDCTGIDAHCILGVTVENVQAQILPSLSHFLGQECLATG